jgi:hypothetical protein
LSIEPRVQDYTDHDDRPALGAEVTVTLIAIVSLAAFLAAEGPGWFGNVFATLIGAA